MTDADALTSTSPLPTEPSLQPAMNEQALDIDDDDDDDFEKEKKFFNDDW
jgi:hypothetical protein